MVVGGVGWLGGVNMVDGRGRVTAVSEEAASDGSVERDE